MESSALFEFALALAGRIEIAVTDETSTALFPCRSARSFRIETTTVSQVVPIVIGNIKRESRLITDEARHYVRVGEAFAGHGTVEHSKDEYVRGDIHAIHG